MSEGAGVMTTLTVPEGVRTVREVVLTNDAPRGFEGAGFPVRRAFAGLDLRHLDPFLMLDHLGAVDYGPGEAKGAPDHPHRGFETVTYLLNGEFEHRDSTGGGGFLRPGDTQWMTAGSGIVHSEMPSDALLRDGGVLHGSQLWVNLPSSLKWTEPRYQDLAGSGFASLTSADGGSVKVIAGSVGDVDGPGQTHTPITYLHATVPSGGRVRIPWREDFNALVYALGGSGTIGRERAPIAEGRSVVLGPGDTIELEGAGRMSDAMHDGDGMLDVLILGGLPIREQIAWYGPFVMNTKDEIHQAIDDYSAGRMGVIPPARA
jgi:redox-sensitive bicupin YhaK (pirin superfamily)